MKIVISNLKYILSTIILVGFSALLSAQTTITDGGSSNACTGTLIQNDASEDATFTISIPDADKIKLVITNVTLTNSQSINIKNSGGSNLVSINGPKSGYSQTYTTPSGTNLINVVVASNTGDANNDVFSIQWTGLLSGTIDASHLKCSGDVAKAIAFPNPSTFSYTYAWSNGSNTQAINNLTVTKYVVTATSSGGCLYKDSVTITEVTPLLSASISETKLACFGVNDGSAQITPAGGTTPYSYKWSGGSITTQASVTGLTPSQSYSVTVTDANNCKLTRNITTSASNSEIIPNATPSSFIGGFGLKCYEDNTGSITLAPTGGNGTYSYLWSNNTDTGSGAQTTVTASGLDAGTYSFTITDGIGCTKSGSQSLTQPAGPITISETLVHPTFNGASNGQIDVVVTNQNGTTTYDWTGTGTTDGNLSQSSLGAGIYSITVTDQNNCTKNASYTLVAPTVLNAGSIQFSGGGTSMIVCNGIGNTNYVFIENTAASGGDPIGGYTYDWQDSVVGGSWTNIAINQTATGYAWLTNITQNTWIRRAVHAQGATKYSTPIFLELTDLAASISESKVACNGVNNGNATVTPSGGAGSYTYLWSGGTNKTEQNVTGLAPSTAYQVTVTDANNCKATATGFTTSPALPSIAIDETISAVTTYGGNDGSITITITNNTGTTNRNWTGTGTTDGNDSSADTQSGLTAGNYTIEVTDANQCTLTESYVLPQASALMGGTINIEGNTTKYICESYNSINLDFEETTAASGGKASPVYTYDFEYKTASSAWIPIVTGQSSGEYIWNNEINTDTWVRRVVHESGAVAYSNSILLDYITDEQPTIYGLKTNYCNNESPSQIIGIPTNSNGLFTGDGITWQLNGKATFSPTIDTIVYPNPIEIVYQYTDSYGCITDTTYNVIIRPIPSPDFTIPAKISKDKDRYIINGATPGGGTFSGDGVTAIDSAINLTSLSGSINVTYSVTNKFSCSNQAIRSTEIVAGTGDIFDITSGISEPMNTYFCYDGDTVFIKAVPSNGPASTKKFISPFVNALNDSTGYFIPSEIGHGSDTIKYSYSVGSETFEITQQIYIDSVINEATIDNLDSEYCYSTNVVNIKANPLKSGDNGSFTGYGIRNAIGANAQFDIDAAWLTATSGKVWYKFTSSKSGCKDSISQNVTINPLPNLGFDIKDTFFVQANPSPFLNVTPATGTFSGDGINNTDKTFNPTAAGIGNHIITFRYTNPTTGCSKDTTKTLLVEDFRGSIAGIPANAIYCKDGVPDTIYYQKVSGYSYSNGKFYINGVLIASSDTMVLNPATLSESNISIEFRYTGSDNITEFWSEKKVRIDDIGTLSINNRKNTYCNYSTADTLVGMRNGVIANLGQFTIVPGVSNLDGLPNIGKALFTPSIAATGNTTITYLYTSTLSGSTCSSSVTKNLTVNPRPTLTFDLPPLYNLNGPNDTLRARPAGGSYNSSQFTINDSIFEPLIAGEGIKTINYNYINPNTLCANTISRTTQIERATGQIVGNNKIYYCYSDGAFTLSAVNVLNSNGLAGTFTGHGITANLGGNQATFSPKTAWDQMNQTGFDSTVTTTVNFNYFGTDNTTLFTISTNLTVRNNGTISISGLNADKAYCANDAPIMLSGSPSPGVFSGTGIENSKYFNPALISGNNTNIHYSYTDNVAGCTFEIIENITIKPLPSISFDLPTQTCINHNSISTYGEPVNGEFFSDLPFTLINNRTDSITITPSKDFVGNFKVNYTYLNPTSGCSDTLTKIIKMDTIPDLSVTGLSEQYCINGSATTIRLNDNGTAVNSGMFSGKGITNNTENNGRAVFDPALAGVSDTIFVRYTYTRSNTGCTNTDSSKVVVKSYPELSFGTHLDGYCTDHATVTINGYPFAAGKSKFTVNGSQTTQTSIDFNPALFNKQEEVPIIYEYTDNNNCTNQIFDTIEIYQIAPTNFSVSDFCITYPIQFTYDSIANWDPLIKNYTWTFYEGSQANEQGSGNSPSFKYETAGSKKVTLNVETKQGCITTQQKTFDFLEIPKANFSWKKDCIGESAVEFYTPISQNAFSFAWNFGDGSQQSQDYNPLHTYTETGNYPVKLVIKTKGIETSCIDSITKHIEIKPSISLNNQNVYTQSFEKGHGGWIADTLPLMDSDTSLWSITTPLESVFSQPPHGSLAYVNLLTDEINLYEQSAIISPCFDFTGLDKPMISFDIWPVCESDRDGAVLEYSTDAGTTWTALGATDEGINWFNSLSIKAKPGGTDKLGWTGEDYQNWISARHDLDTLNRFSNVRFRLSYAAQDRSPMKGFAFDNIYIGNRQQNVLIEHFTNIQNSNAIEADTKINDLTTALPLDVLSIQYHTSYPEGDEFNRLNPSGPSTRSAFYGVNSNPVSLLNGTGKYNFTTNNVPTETDILKKSLQSPKVGLVVENSVTGDRLDLKINIISNVIQFENPLILYVAMVKKTAAVSGKSIVAYNIFNQMLPNNNGELIGKTIHPEGQIFNYSFTMPAGESADQYSAIAFVQDQQTRQILQVASDELNGSTTGNPIAELQNFNLLLFPNPANNFINIAFSPATTEPTQLSITNMQGQVVKYITLESNTEIYQLETSNLTPGIYHLLWQNGRKPVSTKFVVIH